MAFWRPVSGHIQRLDPELVSDADIEKFFADERIIARGRADDDFGYDFEVAIAGRRRRVATLDEDGEVFRGRGVHELAEEMQRVLRKVSVELDGAVLHGEIDLGSVFVTDEDLDPFFEEAMEMDEPNGAATGAPASGERGVGEAQFVNPAEPASVDTIPTSDSVLTPPTPDAATLAALAGESGPSLVLADVPMSEMPVLAAAEAQPIAVSKLGDLRVLVARDRFNLGRVALPRPSVMIALTVPVEGAAKLFIKRDNVRLRWRWEGELPLVEWIAAEPKGPAALFAHDELGAGAVARMAVADAVSASFKDVRSALLEPAERGASAFIRALGLSEEYIEVLVEGAPLEALGVRVFEPSPGTHAFEETVAWELAGEGAIDSSVMNTLRKLTVERPWVPGVMAAAESALGGALIAHGIGRKQKGKRAGLSLVGGGLLLASGVVRVLTTNWMMNVMDRQGSHIEEWKKEK
ncbi:hypothetical protein J2S49_001199 [Arcanobacterium wilhelmae]|uniref:Uncharacterized protein n=1 Tax=Arcanobacterium wilhelmae TaxID=1803177 RepID=A0ABT9NC96_9ACTO|nr:hypothetical protein [Arcanobacterium wilhelmae]MDP9801123.1 hypothetical protein [Arcanobacterium wilhelmae]WFN90476.1 hypothetical protein P8A24_01030 [Arcanobacterium wilhelmae]